MDPIIQQELSRLDPDIPFRATTSHLFHTWARTWYCRPELYLQPQSIEEIQKIVTCARRCRRRLVVVGVGHSPSSMTCTSSWMVNLDHFNKVISEDLEKGTLTVQGGLRLYELGKELKKRGLSMPNLGSIDEQSLAGAITTGTHGSSLQHGLICESISAIKLVLANGQVVHCSATTNPNLFRAALLSLGSLGIIVEITFHAVPDFNISWNQTLQSLTHVLDTWNTSLWNSAEFTRIWWLPYTDGAVVWRADKTDKPLTPPPNSKLGAKVMFHLYHNLLWLAGYFPAINPWVERLVFGLQHGFQPGRKSVTGVSEGHQGLLMDCLFSQYVNEWALPLSSGPEAIRRLRAFLRDPKNHQSISGVPFSAKDVYVHAPIEVRVSNTVQGKTFAANGECRPYLDPSCADEPTLYLNAIMYRPYLRDPPGVERYYKAFEYIMRDLGAKPHWAKNFTADSSVKITEMYGKNLQEFMKVRNESDPQGMFLGEWHRQNLSVTLSRDDSMSEEEVTTRPFGRPSQWGDGLEWIGKRPGSMPDAGKTLVLSETAQSDSSSPPMTATSEESFDYMAKGEASVMFPKDRP